jgi:hypothetical protein
VLIADDRLPDGRAASAVALDALRAAVRCGRIRPERVDEALARIAHLRSRLP